MALSNHDGFRPLSEQEKQPIWEQLEQQFRLLFKKLNVFSIQAAIEMYT